MRRSLLIRSALALVLLFTGVSIAQKKPAQNISAKKHPNLAEAQQLSAQAFEKIVAAQKAKELLNQVNHELKLAAEAANKNK